MTRYLRACSKMTVKDTEDKTVRDTVGVPKSGHPLKPVPEPTEIHFLLEMKKLETFAILMNSGAMKASNNTEAPMR